MDKDRAKQIRQRLKNLGYTSKQISVTSKHAINITIKDLTIELEAIKRIGDEYREIDYCQVSGEILSGGNTFVFTQYDWQAEKAARESEQFKDWFKSCESIFDTQEIGVGIAIGDYVVHKHHNWSFYIWDTNSSNWLHTHCSLEAIAFGLYHLHLRGKIPELKFN